MGGQSPTWKRYPKRIKEADVDHHKTNQWLKSSGLKAETEGFIVAAQDQSLATRSYHASIIKDDTSPLCRMCNKYDDDHILNLRKQNIPTDTIKQPRIYIGKPVTTII